jgi:proline dehydrogenase
MMRAVLLNLSQSRSMRRFVLGFPLARRASRRFVAGETLDEAVAAVKALQEKNILATIDHLGESVMDEADARVATDAYLELLDRVEREWAPGWTRPHASLKLTQLGLDIGQELCEVNLSRILDKARALGTFVRIDMESADYTDRTLAVYRKVRGDFGATVGIVIQSYLYRSAEDVRALISEGIATIRFCKGAYKEPATVAFPRKADVDNNLIKFMEMMLSPEARARGACLAMATHDEKIIEATRAYARANNVPPGAFEFQMLYGIRPALQEKLAREGHIMRVYVPYGNEWYPYFMRRLAERPANVWFIFINLFRT